jgi:putative transposase
VSEATIYNWKAKYGGLEVSEAKRLRALEDENAKLKRLLAEAMLDNAGSEGSSRKKLVTPAAKQGGRASSGVPGDERAAGVSCDRR